ncbi:hypothetical protein C5167_016533 [Papaver somniferum]|nr:hypothetical protein C5167_016533 [Papaver somniferum]
MSEVKFTVKKLRPVMDPKHNIIYIIARPASASSDNKYDQEILQECVWIKKKLMDTLKEIQHHTEVRDCEKKLLELQMVSPLDLETLQQSNQAMEQRKL